ncbi:hypothetical protein EZS27_034560, partial [termite gut metagenome]
MKKVFLFIFISLWGILSVCAQQSSVIVGAEQTEAYFPLLKGKRIALFSNQSGIVGDKHLLDVLIENKVN